MERVWDLPGKAFEDAQRIDILQTMRQPPYFLILLGQLFGLAQAQEPIRFGEDFVVGSQYHVSCRVAIEGTLRFVRGKEVSATTLKITGKSAIDYDERVLQVTAGNVERTVRHVQQWDFHRTVDGNEQSGKLRPTVALLVVQRLNNLELPFSPQGPLLASEIELIRTDVFTPALTGLLPQRAVKEGDEWPATAAAVQELTDLERIHKGGLTCRFEGIEPTDRRLARISFRGVVRGLGEDGPAEHELEGYFYFDLHSRHLSYLSLQGVHRPLNADGLAQGEIKGTFTLTRRPETKIAALSQEALSRWTLTPTDDNTQLLFDHQEFRFLYPRHWRVEEAYGRQVRLVEKQGSDVLITVDPPARLPNSAQFQKEASAGLVQQKGQILNSSIVRAVQTSPFIIEQFGFDVRFGSQLATFDYYVVRQRDGGGTLAARYLPGQAEARRREVERMARSLSVHLR
ncbi:MAG: hypothetical protein NZM29_09035 [Nitrospira sp.]|nr:hypothetical protein [Nitrospira sp.]